MKISIDGPAASGKTAVGKSVSNKLNLRFLDTGLMYRAATWLCVKNNIDLDNIVETTKIVCSTSFRPTSENGETAITINGEIVSRALFTEEINSAVSILAKIKTVREFLVTQQKFIAKSGYIVMVGRDIGTVVMPDAHPKVFLKASLDVRARRRLSEDNLSIDETQFLQIRNNLKARDKIDSERKESPLRPAANALLIDTTEIGIEAIVDTIVGAAKKDVT